MVAKTRGKLRLPAEALEIIAQRFRALGDASREPL